MLRPKNPELDKAEYHFREIDKKLSNVNRIRIEWKKDLF